MAYNRIVKSENYSSENDPCVNNGYKGGWKYNVRDILNVNQNIAHNREDAICQNDICFSSNNEEDPKYKLDQQTCCKAQQPCYTINGDETPQNTCSIHKMNKKKTPTGFNNLDINYSDIESDFSKLSLCTGSICDLNGPDEIDKNNCCAEDFDKEKAVREYLGNDYNINNIIDAVYGSIGAHKNQDILDDFYQGGSQEELHTNILQKMKNLKKTPNCNSLLKKKQFYDRKYDPKTNKCFHEPSSINFWGKQIMTDFRLSKDISGDEIISG